MMQFTVKLIYAGRLVTALCPRSVSIYLIFLFFIINNTLATGSYLNISEYFIYTIVYTN